MSFLIQFLLTLIELYSFVLVLYAFLSWMPGAYDSSFGRFVTQMSEPILRPLRKLHLQFLGLDWTVMVALFLLNGLGQLLIWLWPW